MLGRMKVPACDLTPALREAVNQGRRPYFDFDGHWTPAGHEVVAGAIKACLVRHGLL